MSWPHLVVLFYTGGAFGAAASLACAIFVEIGNDFAMSSKSEEVSNADLDAVRLLCRERPTTAAALCVMIIAAMAACWPATLYVSLKEKKK